MYKALFLSPMIPSFNLQETGQFFKDVLKFTLEMESESYAIYQKDGLTVHLLRAGENIGQMECYLEVNNVDSIWEQIRVQVEHIRSRSPFDRDYGMREIHLHVPATNCLLFIGHDLKRTT